MIRNKHNISLYVSSILVLVLVATQLSVSATVPTTTPALTSTTKAASTSRYGNPLVEHKHERNCKALCEHCGCLGFYCGEECICECNGENEKSDTECIQTMQVNARTLNAPFQILIQGPSSNRFVRNARQFEQKRELVVRNAVENKTPRNRRSTITIYEPLWLGSKRPALSLNALETRMSGAKKSELARIKRSVDHLEWFNDFASTLVRPSPLGTRAQRQRDAKAAAFKRQAATVDPLSSLHREPWFLEQAPPRLTRPAPLYRRQKQIEDMEHSRKSKKSSTRKVAKPVSIEEESETEVPKPQKEIRPLRDALQVVERIPRVLQDTVNHLAADNNSGDVFSLNIMNDVLPKPIERKEPKKVKRRLIERTRNIDRDVAKSDFAVTRAPIVVPPAPLAPRGLLLPWLRLRRLRLMRGEQ